MALFLTAATACAPTTRYRVTSEAGERCADQCEEALGEDEAPGDKVHLDCLASCEGVVVEEAECAGGSELSCFEQEGEGSGKVFVIIAGVVLLVGLVVLGVIACELSHCDDCYE